MAIRTSQALVQAVLETGEDYDTVKATSLTPFITAANKMVDRVKADASSKKNVTLTDTGEDSECELIERWLSAHFYCQSDKPVQSKSTGGASGSFIGQTAMGLDSTLYGQTAQRLDWSGILRNMDKQQLASTGWIGTPRRDQQSYQEREE